MTKVYNQLTFDTLREANLTRLPQFKNRKGEPAHTEPDGADWALSAWSNAASGEQGEAAEALLHLIFFTLMVQHLGKAGDIIKKIERGDVTISDKRKDLADELADVITYVDILAYRAQINLGEAVVGKWNEVSERVGCSLRIDDNRTKLNDRGLIELVQVATLVDLDAPSPYKLSE